MERKTAEEIVEYYMEIPGMMNLLRQEKEKIERKRNEEPEAYCRIAEIDVNMQVLERDEVSIRSCIDGLNSKYKKLILLRSGNRYSWGGVAARVGLPESTARDWHKKACRKLGDMMEEIPMIEELVYRASRAR